MRSPCVPIWSHLRFGFLAVFAVLLTLSTASPARAETDPHALFEARCGACHEHAGDLARDNLVVVEGALVGRKTGNDIRAFLPAHYGQLSADESAVLYDMLLRQVAAAGFFKERCSICHVRARDLVRADLVVVGGELRGRYSGRDMAAFLPGHGRLDAEEAAFMHDVLSRIAQGRR